MDFIALITGRNVGVGGSGEGVAVEKVFGRRTIDEAPPWRNGVERERHLNWRIGGEVRDIFFEGGLWISGGDDEESFSLHFREKVELFNFFPNQFVKVGVFLKRVDSWGLFWLM